MFGSSVIHPVDSTLNLGVIWDKHLRMKSHISRICSVASLALSRIGALHNYLDKSSVERLVHAFISSRIDYCNSLLFGLPSKELNRLQSIQNAAARLISGVKKRDHITPILKKLHWLPVKARIDYKILLITFKIICGCCPTYLSQLITLHQSNHYLRSTTRTDLLSQPRSKFKNCGDRTFSNAAPRLWNSLSDHVRNAQTIETFKTHLFKIITLKS